jgi:hypothetical protein
MKLTRAAVSLTAAVIAGCGAVAVSVMPASAATAATPTTPSAWKSVALPSSVKEPAELADISAVSTSLAWAVGAQAETSVGTGTPLILRWNGAKWSSVSLPGVSAPGALTSVSATSATNA